MNMLDRIHQMYSRPGIYIVQMPIGVVVVESKNGEVQQCKPYPPYKPDGVLRRAGWNPSKVNDIIGPFERKENMQ